MKITLMLDERDVMYLSLTAIDRQYEFQRVAKKENAAMWKRIHDEIRAQYKAQKEAHQ